MHTSQPTKMGNRDTWSRILSKGHISQCSWWTPDKLKQNLTSKSELTLFKYIPPSQAEINYYFCLHPLRHYSGLGKMRCVWSYSPLRYLHTTSSRRVHDQKSQGDGWRIVCSWLSTPKQGIQLRRTKMAMQDLVYIYQVYITCMVDCSRTSCTGKYAFWRDYR